MALRLVTAPDAVPRAEWVARELAAAGTAVEVSLTDGGSGDPLEAFGRGDAHLALVRATRLRYRTRHGLPLLAVPRREEPRDVLVVPGDGPRSLRTLPPGTRVGVSGARRRAFLRAHRRDLMVVNLEDGRPAAQVLAGGRVDAVVLGLAEAREMDLRADGVEVLDPREWLPAPGQGAFALLGGPELRRLPGLERVDHAPSRAALEAELALVEVLGLPPASAFGALAQPAGDLLRIWAAAASEDGTSLVRAERTARREAPREGAEAVARELVDRGLATVLACRGETEAGVTG